MLLEVLQKLDSNGLLRRLPPEVEIPGPRIARNGTSLVCLASNNYLGLASHPEVIEASCQATRRSGCSATGSRLLSGNLELHGELEARLAKFKGAESGLLLNSGYSANLAVLGALARPGDRIVSDKLNHASLHDGAKASGAECRIYRHGDLGRTRDLLASTPAGVRKFLVSDGVFSMDGDVAPLPELVQIARETGAVLILDEAHATGVLGHHGKGSFEHFGLPCDARALGLAALVVVGTFGKALGGFGAYALTDPETREILINRARPFVFSTALPPSVLGAALGALDVLEREPSRVEDLRNKSRFFREKLNQAGFQVPLDPTPIIPIIVGEAERAVQFAKGLLEEGVQVFAVRPPSVPPGTSRIRATLMATHEHSDLVRCVEAFEKVGKACGVIR